MPRGKRIDDDWLREHYPIMTDIEELLDDFERQFGYRPTRTAVYTKANKLGIKKKPITGRNDRCERVVRWSKEPELLAWMLEHDHGQRIDSLSEDFRKRFGFSLSRGQIDIFRSNYGRRTRVNKTHKGGRRRVPVGTERTSKDGYIVVKVREEARKSMSKDNWMLKHVWVWEQAHGKKLPKGHLVMFADKDKTNFDPDNLVAVSRKLIGVINGMHVEWHDRESLEAVIAMAKIRVTRNRVEASIERVCPCCGKTFNNLHRLEYGGSIKSTVCEECGMAGRKPPTKVGGRRRVFDHERIRELYAQGYKQERIADIMGCTRSTVSAAIHKRDRKKHK